MSYFANLLGPVTADHTAMCVRVGDWSSSEVNLTRKRESDFSIKCKVLQENGVPAPRLRYPTDQKYPDDIFGESKQRSAEWGRRLKEAHSYCHRFLGNKFNHRLYGARFNLFVSGWMPLPMWKFLKFDGHNWRRWNLESVSRANSVRPDVLQAHRDGLSHLAPAIIAFQASPKDIRARLGRATWRRISANSETRNHKIAQMATRLSRSQTIEESWEAGLKIPSGVLHAIEPGVEYTLHAARIMDRVSRASYEEALHLIRDSHNMGAYNPTWGLRRLRGEHDAASRRIAIQRFSDAAFCEPHELIVNGYLFRRLISQAEVAAEGLTMSHCVSSYASKCEGRQYAVYHVEKEDEIATLGLVPARNGPRIDQLYGWANSRVSDPLSAAAKDFANDLGVASRLAREWQG